MAAMTSQFSIDRDLFTKPLLMDLELIFVFCSSFFFTRNMAIILGLETLKNQSPRLHNQGLRIPQTYFG